HTHTHFLSLSLSVLSFFPLFPIPSLSSLMISWCGALHSAYHQRRTGRDVEERKEGEDREREREKVEESGQYQFFINASFSTTHCLHDVLGDDARSCKVASLTRNAPTSVCFSVSLRCYLCFSCALSLVLSLSLSLSLPLSLSLSFSLSLSLCLSVVQTCSTPAPCTSVSAGF